MDVRGLVQGLIAPDPQPAAPYRRQRGSLIFPACSAAVAATEAVTARPVWSALLLPSPSESPVWPYETWSIESFSFRWTYTSSPETFVEEPQELALTFTLSAGGDDRWSAALSRDWPPDERKSLGFPKPVTLAGTVYSNLASPLLLQGGEQFQLGVKVETPRNPPGGPGDTAQEVRVDGFRLPYSVDHGGG